MTPADLLAGSASIASVVAVIIAALSLLESRKQRKLLDTLSLFLTRRNRRQAKSEGAVDGTKATRGVAKAAAEERKRLQVQLDREKHEWRKNRDIAKLIAWVLDRVN